MAGRTPRLHRAHFRYLCKLRDWAHSQSYAAVFQLYAIRGRAHFRHRPMQLHAIHRGWAHSQAFGGNVRAFNANATSQASTRFAQLVWPHGYCWYPPKIKKIHLSWSTASLKPFTPDRSNSIDRRVPLCFWVPSPLNSP